MNILYQRSAHKINDKKKEKKDPEIPYQTWHHKNFSSCSRPQSHRAAILSIIG